MQDTFAYRPKLHFTAPKNWLNDPNGLVCAGGYYHLFYQHHPFGTQWGPMHWGHAVSRDLYHWEHRDIALYPDEKGMIFSGSAVIDEKNVSGLGDGKTPPMLLFFTYDTGETEYQSMAYSLDEGKTFQKYGKILIENPGIRDFRDPKVIRVGDDWVMALAVKDSCWFYRSHNLLDWEKTGAFGPLPESEAPEGAVWECPDLYALPTQDGHMRWVLTISMQIPMELGGVRTRYWLGEFANGTFTASDPCGQWVDNGFDCYAGTTYSNAPQPTFIAWGDNMVYAGEAPTGEWRCHMTLPRVLSLQKTPEGDRLAAWPFIPKEAPVLMDCPPKTQGELTGTTCLLKVTGSGEGIVTLRTPSGKAFRFGVNEKNEFVIDRRDVCKPFSDNYTADLLTRGAVRFFEGDWELLAVLDGCAFEMFGDKGTRAFSVSLFPGEAFTRFDVQGQAAVQVYDL